MRAFEQQTKFLRLAGIAAASGGRHAAASWAQSRLHRPFPPRLRRHLRMRRHTDRIRDDWIHPVRISGPDVPAQS